MGKLIYYREVLKKSIKLLLGKGFFIFIVLSAILSILLTHKFDIEMILLISLFICMPIIALLYIFIFMIELIYISKYGEKFIAKVINIEPFGSIKGVSTYIMYLEFEYRSNIVVREYRKSALLSIDDSKFISKHFNKYYNIYYTDKLPDRVFKYPIIKEYLIIITIIIIFLMSSLALYNI